MFARSALLRATPSRVGLTPRLAPTPMAMSMLRSRAASSKAPIKGGKLKQLWAHVPVDVYPLVFFVSSVCCLGIFTMGWHLATDIHLRLLPDRARAVAE